jgi:hypothetical protein
MKKVGPLGTAALLVIMLVGLAGTVPAKGATLTVTEGGSVLTINGNIVIASDVESSFNPSGFGTSDISDGIILPTLIGTGPGPTPWIEDPSSSAWVSLGNNTWVLPADLTGIGCGSENNSSCEPVGIWSNATPWNSSTQFLGVVTLLEPDGITWSDTITFSNNGPNGGALVTFVSDPGPVPLPAALPLFATGLGVMGLFGWRRKRKNAAALAAA